MFRSKSLTKAIALLTHLAFLVDFVLPGASVLFNAMVWRQYRNRDMFVAKHGLEALNGRLFFLVAQLIVGGIGFGVLVRFRDHLHNPLVIWTLVGLAAILIGLAITGLVFAIHGVLAASENRLYRYPLALRVFRDPYIDNTLKLQTQMPV